MKYLLLSVSFLFLFSCSGGGNETKKRKIIPVKKVAEATTPTSVKVELVTSIDLGEIDTKLAAEGKESYKRNCTSCHKLGKKLIGPALKGVTERRKPEWIINMIMHPDYMTTHDPIAKKLLEEYVAPMANQSISKSEARSILEFLRTNK
ncbi:cytochrome c [Flammeovirga pectinis]|uniref:Cytochrome c n=1 Tax=Flammeovirga pectinis TaxID=2494373 RepID=A0A3S9NY18_9BACT|nr:cytochrome c [Flammeovirga pectinis]AZQ60848.1 cytochrome c [Flammeovirga pectinis]